MKKFRVFCTDPDATDSSSSDEDDNIPQKPTKTKRFLREVTIDTGDPPPVSPPLEPPLKVEKKYPGVRKRLSGKFTAEIRDPIKKAKIWLGSFDSAEKAYDAYCLKRLEFDALKKCDEKEVGDVEVPKGVFRVNTGKWGVLIDDPNSRGRVWLGSYESVDEAIRVYREKECEFEERVVVKERLLSDFYDDGDSCVECLEDGMWQGRVWNPELRSLVCVGRFGTREQARNVVRREEVLLRRRRFDGERVDQFEGDDECGGSGGKADVGSRDGVGYDYTDVIIALAVPRLSKEDIAKKRKNVNLRRETIRGCDFSGKGEGSGEKIVNSMFVKVMSEEKCGDVELPPGVRMTRAGRFGAWVTHPVSGIEYCVRSYDTIEKAVEGIKRKMAQFEEDFNSKKRARVDVPGTPKKASCEAIHGSPSSVLDVRNEDLETSGTNIKTEVEYGPIHGSPTSTFKDKRETNEDVSVHESKELDNTGSENQQNLDWLFTFNEAVKLGIMNEYGQLLGEYCECDESMWLSNRNGDEATTWYY